LDTEIYIAYTLARAAARVLGDDFDLAKAQPSLGYDPHNVEAEERMSSQPHIYRQQGVPRGILENAIEALIVREADGASRVMSFLEFERELDQADSVVGGAVRRIRYLMADFHPGQRPVLWRVLLATASIYQAIGLLSDRGHTDAALPDLKEVLRFSREERRSFDWRGPQSSISSEEAVDSSFNAVDAYLARTLDQDLQRIVRSTHAS
jgi:hypothetical protein